MNDNIKKDPDCYSFVVKLHGKTILDGRLWPNAGQHMCWDEDCGSCVPYVKLPETPAGDDPYTSCDLNSADGCYPDEDRIADESTYYPTLQDWMDGTNGTTGTVTRDDSARTVTFDFK